MKSKDELKEIHRRVDQAVYKGGDVNLVSAIETRLKNEADEATRRELNLALASAYRSLERFADSKRIYLMLANQSPDEPMPLIILAGQKLNEENQPAAAMQVIDRAIKAAYRSNNFRRLALGAKARIALEQKKFSVVEDVIRQLLQLRHDKRGVDIGRERDFFDRLPPGAIDENLAREFDQYSRSARSSGR